MLGKRVVGLLCRGGGCGLLLQMGREAWSYCCCSSDAYGASMSLCLGQVCAATCGRSVAGFGEAFFGGFDAGFELFEFGGFGGEGLFSSGERYRLAS